MREEKSKRTNGEGEADESSLGRNNTISHIAEGFHAHPRALANLDRGISQI
jgi:hypothetical protein